MHNLLPTCSNRCAWLETVAYGFGHYLSAHHTLFLWGCITFFFISSKTTHLPKPFNLLRRSDALFVWWTQRLPLCITLEALHCLSMLNLFPCDSSSAFSMELLHLLHSTLGKAGWIYPLHSMTALHIKCMHHVWMLDRKSVV